MVALYSYAVLLTSITVEAEIYTAFPAVEYNSFDCLLRNCVLFLVVLCWHPGMIRDYYGHGHYEEYNLPFNDQV